MEKWIDSAYSNPRWSAVCECSHSAAVKLQFISAIRNGMLDAENKPACGGRVELRASMPYRTGSNERQLLAGYEQAATHSVCDNRRWNGNNLAREGIPKRRSWLSEGRFRRGRIQIQRNRSQDTHARAVEHHPHVFQSNGRLFDRQGHPGQMREHGIFALALQGEHGQNEVLVGFAMNNWDLRFGSA